MEQHGVVRFLTVNANEIEIELAHVYGGEAL
jgi:hypothetical protein